MSNVDESKKKWEERKDVSLVHYALTAGKISETFTVGVPLVFEF